MNKIVAHNGGVEHLPLIVIVGPTASGKSATALRIAEEFGGEIICADSRTIYKGMDIGTAKPDAEDRARVPHWGLDLVEPGDVFTAADFKRYALKKIDKIRERGHIPMLAGGTGLYIDGVVFDYQFAAPNSTLRAALEAMTLEELKSYCYSNNIELPENENNRRYVIRTIEKQGASTNRDKQPIPNTIIVGITTEKNELRARIANRAEHLFENGMVEEAILLGKKYGWKSEAMTGNIYKLVKQYVDGALSESELRQHFITSDWQLAKRQLTWLRRNSFIHWATLDDAYLYIKRLLSARKESE